MLSALRELQALQVAVWPCSVHVPSTVYTCPACTALCLQSASMLQGDAVGDEAAARRCNMRRVDAAMPHTQNGSKCTADMLRAWLPMYSCTACLCELQVEGGCMFKSGSWLLALLLLKHAAVSGCFQMGAASLRAAGTCSGGT